ncbi:hypothetical protein FB451DRAFT_1193107 [Mycena latifolia]|nr:hypothetical protein FB451DRAFT_1193107 [Mycena latifolia]
MYALGTRCCHRSPSKWRDFGSIAYRHIGMDMLLAGYAIAATIMTAGGLNSLDSWAHHGLARGPKKQPVQCKIAATAALKSDFFPPHVARGMLGPLLASQGAQNCSLWRAKIPKKSPAGLVPGAPGGRNTLGAPSQTALWVFPHHSGWVLPPAWVSHYSWDPFGVVIWEGHNYPTMVQPGINLPAGWDTINWGKMPEDLRYKYFLFLAQDCNFRLINCNISSEAKDPILNDGMGYFVNYSKYLAWLREHVSEEEISSCSGFQAMFLANHKRVKGLRTSGVGGVTCARHNMWRPNGIRDLQVGEQYCNMDFILFSALLNTIIFYLILSYDIACQYGKNFWSRMEALPAPFHISVSKLRVWFKVPNFHLLGHKDACHSAFSFHWMWGAGRTHAETVEQNWEFTNGVASSTKMMGMGSQATTLEDMFGFHNWRRMVSWRGIFMKRMGEDVREGRVHREAFDAFTLALQESVPDLVKSWQVWVAEWEAKQHMDSTESPFDMSKKVYTMKDIRLKLAKEELIRSRAGVEVEHEDTAGTFILMGLEIEQSQYGSVTSNDAQNTDFIKRRAAVLRRIRGFRKLQKQYMPNLQTYLSQSQQGVWDNQGVREAEAVRLFMPSDIADSKKRDQACAVGLPTVEEELREGEAHESLEELLRNLTGQQALTRGQGVLQQINVRIHKAKLCYRYARNAVLRLRGHGPWEKVLQALEDKDIRALNEHAMTEEEVARRQVLKELGEVVEGGIEELEARTGGETQRTLSWIWYTAKPTDPEEQELVEALRVEWCKAYAWLRRWTEDVVLVEEEMRQTIEFGYWAAAEWQLRASRRTGEVSKEVREGLVAYAREQSKREVDTCEKLQTQWAGIRAKGQVYLTGEALATVEEVVIPLEQEEEREEEEDLGRDEFVDDDDEELEDDD